MREISERERERYQRNLLVDGFGEQGQSRLLESRVTVVGAGGLGSAVLNYLVAAGVGHIRIVESDTVSPSNLQRKCCTRLPRSGHRKPRLRPRVFRG